MQWNDCLVGSDGLPNSAQTQHWRRWHRAVSHSVSLQRSTLAASACSCRCWQWEGARHQSQRSGCRTWGTVPAGRSGPEGQLLDRLSASLRTLHWVQFWNWCMHSNIHWSIKSENFAISVTRHKNNTSVSVSRMGFHQVLGWLQLTNVHMVKHPDLLPICYATLLEKSTISYQSISNNPLHAAFLKCRRPATTSYDIVEAHCYVEYEVGLLNLKRSRKQSWTITGRFGYEGLYQPYTN